MIQRGNKPPGVLKTLIEAVSHVKSTSNLQNNCKLTLSPPFCLYIYFYIKLEQFLLFKLFLSSIREGIGIRNLL